MCIRDRARTWSRSFPGMTTNGAIRAGWRISPPSSVNRVSLSRPPYDARIQRLGRQWTHRPVGKSHMTKRSIRSADVAGKNVLVRVDFNVPLNNGKITDDTRIRAVLPTIQWLIDRDARIILCSHLGRPGGKVVDKLRMAPVGERLAELLDLPVRVMSSITGPDVLEATDNLRDGEAVSYTHLTLPTILRV